MRKLATLVATLLMGIDVAILEFTAAAVAALFAQEQPATNRIVVTEIFWTAPDSITTNIGWACAPHQANLTISVPSEGTPTGAQQFAEPTILATFNGHPISVDASAELQAAARAVGRFPHIVPFCRQGWPGVTIQEEDRVERWTFPEAE